MSKALPRVIVYLLLWSWAISGRAAELPSTVQSFLKQHCFDCHDVETKSGGLDLTAVNVDFADAANFAQWVRVHDRVQAGEMPPPTADVKTNEIDRKPLLKGLGGLLSAEDGRRQRTAGRVPLRRLNRAEYENTLRDLFAMPGLSVKELLPEDGRLDGFDKASGALEISAVQLRKYLKAADYVLDEAIAHEAKPSVYKARMRSVGGTSAFGLSSFPINDMQVDRDLVRSLFKMRLPLKEPHLEASDSLGIITSARESYRPGVGSFAAFHPGYHRIRMSIWSFDYKAGKIMPGRRMQSMALLANERLLAYFDAPSLKPQEHEVVVWLNAGESLQLNPANLWPNYYNPLGYSGPCVAVDWVEVEGPLYESWPPESHRRLFGNLPLAPLSTEKGRPVPRQPVPPLRFSGARPSHKDFLEFHKNQPVWTAASPLPAKDAERLLADFLPRAFRRPVAAEEVAEYVKIAHARLAAGDFFESAMRAAYRTALCSPDFLFLNEPPGLVSPTDPMALDTYAVAARLSYFLWNSLPDDVMTEAVARKKFSVTEQVERLLADPRSDR